MNSKGDVVWEFRPADKAAFDTAFSAASLLVEMQKKAAANSDDKASIAGVKLLDHFGRQQRPTSLKDDEIKAFGATEGLDARVKTHFKTWQNNQKFTDAFQSTRADGGAAIFNLFKEGVDVPSQMALPFYYWVVQGAIKAKDADRGNKALELFIKAGSKRKGFAEQAKKDIEKMRAKLKELSAGK